MQPRISQRVRELFYQAIQCPPEGRTNWIVSLDTEDRALVAEVDSLLASFDDAGDFLAEPQLATPALKEPAGTQIGQFVIQRHIGEGGFGDIYLAEQTEPVRRRVALKIIKPGMDSREVMRRFRAERQALALLEHPNIARIIDGGATPAGRPYFVMELVEGSRITHFCDEHRLPIVRRIELFLQVCDAVQHAHQRGVIHRDLKPANVLISEVDAKATPKVIDFGIAKILRTDEEPDNTLVTIKAHSLGTPVYMSPEQMRGQSVDTRTDVYSLGVLLYELLCGRLPFDKHERDREVPPMTQRLAESDSAASDLATARSTTAVALIRTLRGEPEWIAARCLPIDPSERYATVNGLISDLQAHLAGQPVTAAPPSRSYRVRKFVARHRAAVFSVALAMLGMLAIAIVMTNLAVRATRAERLAQKRLEDVEAVNEFLTQDMIGSADPAVTQGKDLSVIDALDRAARALAVKFRDRPLTEATVRESVAWAYLALGKADLALPHSTAALEQRKRILGEDDPQTIQSIHTYAAVLKSKGQLAESEALLEAALEKSRRVNGEDHPTTIEILDSYATVLTSQGKYGQSQPLAKAAMEQARRVHGEGQFKTLSTMSNYARVLYQMGRNAEAEPLLKEAMDQSVRTNGEDHPESIAQMSNLATTLTHLGRFSEAEPLSQRSLDLRRQVFGEDHPLTLVSRDTHAGLLFRMGKFEESARTFKDVIERARVKEGEDHPYTLTAMNNYAVVLQASNHAPEAEVLLVQVLERRRRTQGHKHPDTLIAMANYARAMQVAGNPSGAEPILREALEQQRLLLGVDHPSALASLHNYADLLRVLNRAAEAEPFAREAMERFRRVLGEQHPSTLSSMNNYIAVLVVLGRDRDAEPICADLYQKAAAAQLPKSQAAIYIANYGPCLARLDRYADAEVPLMEAHRRLIETNQRTTPRMRQVLESLAKLCDNTKRPEEAAKWRAELAAVQATTQPAPRPTSQSP